MTEKLQRALRSKNIYFYFSIPLIIYAVYVICGIIFHTITDAGIPNEYRECANVLMTMEFIKGNNPYSLDALRGDLPPMIYLYGPLYSLVTAGLGAVLGLLHIPFDIVGIHYFITFLCIIISAALAFKMVYDETGSFAFGLGAFAFLINCSWRYNYVNAVPDCMGLAIMMLILFILTKRKMRGSEILVAALTVLIFFTKQYYLLIAGTVTGFLFIFRGIKSTAKYLACLAGFFILTALLIQWQCPLFWTYTLYLAKGPGVGVARTVTRGAVKISGTQYNIQQIMSLGGIFLMFFVTEAAGCIYFLKSFIKEIPGHNIMKDGWELLLRKTGVSTFDALMLMHMGVAGICLTYLGRNDGAWLSYYLELFMPALIMGALSLFDKLAKKATGRKMMVAFAVYFVIFMGFTAFRASGRLPVSPLSEEDHREWEAAEKLLDQNPGDMYLYPHLAYYGINNDIYIYNTGQPFVVSEKFYKSYHKHPEKMEKYPYAEDIFTSHFAYREKIRDRVRNGEYSVVSYVEGTDEVFTREDLSAFYRPAATCALRTGRQVWDTELWIRK